MNNVARIPEAQEHRRIHASHNFVYTPEENVFPKSLHNLCFLAISNATPEKLGNFTDGVSRFNKNPPKVCLDGFTQKELQKVIKHLKDIGYRTMNPPEDNQLHIYYQPA